MKDEQPYNPLDKKHLGESVAIALLERSVSPLPLKESFRGIGVYAIYYTGNFPLYRPIAEKNRKDKFAWPIYVGKAVPAGSRRGGVGLGANPSLALYKRLQEHADSIQECSNLEIKDFHCRYLVVDDIWIPLGESLLIERFAPVWNRCLDGFGNHNPGSGRYNQQISAWDVLHPGRGWANRLKPNQRMMQDIESKAQEFIKKCVSLIE